MQVTTRVHQASTFFRAGCEAGSRFILAIPRRGGRGWRVSQSLPFQNGRLRAAHVGVQDSDAPGPLGASCFCAPQVFPSWRFSPPVGFGASEFCRHPRRAPLSGSGHQSFAGNRARPAGIYISFSMPTVGACLHPAPLESGGGCLYVPSASPGVPPPPRLWNLAVVACVSPRLPQACLHLGLRQVSCGPEGPPTTFPARSLPSGPHPGAFPSRFHFRMGDSVPRVSACRTLMPRARTGILLREFFL